MKSLFLILLSFCLIGTVNAQTTQKLSLGILGGLNTPMHIRVQGKQPNSFKSNRTTASSKGIFLQYELTDNLFVRGTFKKGTINLKNRFQHFGKDTLGIERDYEAGFDNKQYELSLGYRKNITKALHFTGSLGVALLDLENVSMPIKSDVLSEPHPDMVYWVSAGTNTLKEKSVLVNAALGLEYKTKRGNAFLLEAAYYKGFNTIGSFDFKMDDYLSQTPNVLHYESSIKTKGDYAEIRLGYRMPIQKFVNFYKAVKFPRSDSVAKPIYHGKYWGLETGKQTFYANQVQEDPGYTQKAQVASTWTSYLTFYKGYQFRSRLNLEAGFRVGTSNINYASTSRIGYGGWSLLILTTPVSVRYALPIVRNKLFISPEVGLWQSYVDDLGSMEGYPRMNGMVTRLKGYHDYFVGYHAGLNLNGRVGKACEIGIGYRYANRFSSKPIMEIGPDYEHTVEPQLRIVSKSNLKNDAITISFRKFIRKK
ncbi:hypothetical protein [Adhaeribacter terreus]|uniref:DUF5723 domain-containing protein n=1 Tax=Adhaeribacter terreus TaxID=529703 RepID=A0ABW0EDM7_9BACT